MGTAQNIQSFDENIQRLIETVAYNCNIADAQNAQENTMCIYLLKMRDYYRWHHNLPLNASIPKDKLGKWISEREDSWEDICEEDFQQLNIAGHSFDPFDTENINTALQESGLHYSAGIGRGGQVHFHLGAEIPFLTDREKSIFVTSVEYARDLTASPAHSLNGNIFLRKEALQHYIWGKYEEWSWKKPDSAMGRAIASYPFETDPMRALNQMSGNEIYSTLLHEEGELAAGEILGEQWEEMLMALSGSRAEILARATRDHLADCLVTLPTLIKEENWPSIHFYFANFDGFRKLLWPEIIEIYKASLEKNSLTLFGDYITHQAQAFWVKHTSNLLEKFNQPHEKFHQDVTRYFDRAFGL